MRNPSKAFCLLIGLALSVQACNIKIDMSNPAATVAPIALTITAQAAILQQGNQVPPSPANVEPTAQTDPDTASATPTNPSESVSAASTNTLAQGGPVTVKVTAETNCRSGPGLIYNSLYSMTVSDVAEVIGKNTLTNYWIIKIPNGGGKTCWLWGQYAVITGDTSALAEVSTPTPLAATATKVFTPTATITKTVAPLGVAPPSNVQVTNKTCADLGNGSTRYTGTISWSDNSNDELGFAITMPGFAASVGVNVTSFNFDVFLTNVSYSMGSSIGVEVTTLGQSSTAAKTITFSCP